MGKVARVLSTCTSVMLQGQFHDRLTLEACDNVRLHWRNVQVEMSLSDAGRLFDVCWRFENLMPFLQERVISIPLSAICPYDERHRRVSEDEFDNGTSEATAEHRAGIAWMVEQIKGGRKPWPIAVRPAWRGRFSRSQDRKPGNIWQRLDGFKRYMAHRVLNLPCIDCFLIADHRPGCQHGQYPFQEDGQELPRVFPKDFFLDATPERLSLVDSDKQNYLVNQVQLLANGTIHVHVGDTRLEFDPAEFRAFANMIQRAQASL